MVKKLIWNDIKQNKLLAGATIFFMGISAMIFALTALLFFHLMGAIDGLMDRAKVPDYMQMHTEGSAFVENKGISMEGCSIVQESEIRRFSEMHGEVSEWQICRFLNMDNSQVFLGGKSLADSTQDNGLCVQGERFDYLLNMENKKAEVLPGEVYVPVCYRIRYDLAAGDTMEIGGQCLTIVGFLRDAQMNSMMASSKRFLVNREDYEQIKASGSAQEEYLIEFLLCEGTDTNVFGTAYASAGLPANGPAITKPLIRMMNALSDGTMIFVIFLTGVVILLISILCIRFMLSLQMERDRREVGMLKALGVGKAEIFKIYFAKYILLSACGGLIGFLTACVLKEPLAGQMRELYGILADGWKMTGMSLAVVFFTEGIILFAVMHSLKKTSRISALEALFSAQERKMGRGRYWIIGFVSAFCTFLALVPRNLYSTMSDPKFVTYMGIGDGEIRMDVRQTQDMDVAAGQITSALALDPGVEKYVALSARSCKVILTGGEMVNITVETGDHNIFPVYCSEGKMPEKEGEIALSSMNAKELDLQIGDALRLVTEGQVTEYRICGIYPDITNGGKTAKAYRVSDRAPVVWSVLYVSLKKTANKEEWMKRYGKMGADVTDIEGYVRDTYGQTLGQLRLASATAIILAALVVGMVVMLFIRLIVEENRYAISLHKALGFTGREMKRIYFIKGCLPVAAGVMGGLLVGNLLGEGLCGIILESFGAEGFRFITAWEQVLAIIPAVILGTAVPALSAGTGEIGRIRAYECCNRRD